MEPETEHSAIWKDILLKSYFPNGSPWFIVDNVLWQYCWVFWVLMEPKGLKRDIGNQSVKFEIFFGPQILRKPPNTYKEERFWTKSFNFSTGLHNFYGFPTPGNVILDFGIKTYWRPSVK